MKQSILILFFALGCFAFDFSIYNKLDDIERYLTTLDSFKGRVKSRLESIGTTYEGRSINMITMSTNARAPYCGCKKKAILVECGIHSREFISIAFCLYFMDFLKNTQTGIQLVKKFDWYLIPVLNPDGYVYSMNVERLWRKNRNPFNETCVGTDLNRNFGMEWDPANGGSDDPCNLFSYSGPQSFSELESQAARDVIVNRGIDFVGYLGVHAFGQMWIYPWGYTFDLVPDDATLAKCAQIATAAATDRNGIPYTYGKVTDFFPTIGGLAVDYAKSAGIKFSYEIELRDNGTFGHLLPEDQIIPTSEETTDAIVAWADCVCAEIAS
ncbi:CPO [Mytilus edulis]|uniref:CPO n=1 Tax=Mytilus edulis TaxID=6550 RepID=A0A8S3SKE1_MYTED|nr:CPO [Mytilus edulis]